MSTDFEVNPQHYPCPDRILDERIILITGASDGIGRALALRSAQLGARVILHGRDVARLERVYDEIDALPGTAAPSIAVIDFATAGSQAYIELAENIESEFGRLDGLVHNASMLGERYSIEQYEIELWQRVLHVNVTAAVALTQLCLPLLGNARDPSVIFTSSGVGRHGRAFWGAYAVSKFATEGLSQVLADEHRHGPLRVNCVNPGAVRTKMRQAAFPAEDPQTLKLPEDILPTYVYLLGPDSHGVTGNSFDCQ